MIPHDFVGFAIRFAVLNLMIYNAPHEIEVVFHGYVTVLKIMYM
jgi:hypothetical protein